MQTAADTEISPARLRRHLGMLFDGDDPVGVASLDGIVIDINPAWRAMLGYEVTELLGRRVTEFAPPGLAPLLAQQFVDVAARASGRVLGLPLLRKDGATIVADFSVRTTSVGGQAFVVAVAHDVTGGARALQHAEARYQALVQQQQRLEDELCQAQKMEAIGAVTGGIAHDFNNVMGIILSTARALARDLEPGDPRGADVGDIVLGAEKALALTRQLLAYARHQAPTSADVDVGAAARAMEQLLRRLLGSGFSVVITSSSTGVVRIDPCQLEQVILNLTVNARDAMGTRGDLQLTISDVDDDAGRWVVLAVRDNGCGMSPEVKSRLFTPFFTTKEPGKGTGLGLSTTHKIVARAGGRIEVDSEAGKGSCFSVFLPRG